MAVIAIDVGGTKISSAIFKDDGTMMSLHKNMLNGREGHDVGNLIIESLQRQLQSARYHRIDITDIGVCIPGNADPCTGRVWAPNIPGWQNYPLRDMIKNSLTDKSVNIHVDNDRICYVYGEMWQGAAKNCDNVVFMAVGTGIGAGIIIDGHALHGASGCVGATGWMALEPPYRTEYDPVGCFEYYASGPGISNRAKELVKADKTYRGELRQTPISRITTSRVFAAYASGDPIATKVVEKAITFWGMAAANFVSLLNPEKIIWGGGVFGPARNLIDRIYAEAGKWAQPLNIKEVSFEPSVVNSGNAGLTGAAYIAKMHGNV